MTVAQRGCGEVLQTASSESARSSDAVRDLYLMILPAAALLVLVLWCALVAGWALILGRMEQSVSTGHELEEAMPADRQESLANLSRPGDR
jgi:hypothetical protein